MSAKYTPDVAELLPVRQYRCEHCKDQVFGNQSHLQLHLRRRHKLTANINHVSAFTYHCPVDKCIYHANRVEGRGFAHLKLLRQHYQKIHMAKEHKCKECDETFLLQRHLEKHKCCSVYECSDCGLTYSSKASLQTHMRRKQHPNSSNNNDISETATPESSKVPLQTLSSWRKSQKNSLDITTIIPESPPPKDIAFTETSMQPTYCLPVTEIPYSATQTDNFVEPTWTDVDLQQSAANVSDLTMHNFLDEEVDRLLRDMETQTDDVDLDALDINNDVLLRNMETQTLDNRHHQGTMTDLDAEMPEDDYDAYQEAEPLFGPQTSAHMHTQTCDELFEELGLSHIQTQTQWSDDGLYNTQHTQTCDQMLDELLENFQSTCTQTRWLD